MDRLRWCIVALNMILVVAALSNVSSEDYPLREAMELPDGRVWIFTCDAYCAFCGCIGNFQEDQNKCICNCERNATDLDCLDDVKRTKEFLGLNHILEIRYFESNMREDVPGVRLTRQISSPIGERRPFGARRTPRKPRIQNPLKPRPKPEAGRRPFRPRGVRRPLAPPLM